MANVILKKKTTSFKLKLVTVSNKEITLLHGEELNETLTITPQDFADRNSFDSLVFVFESIKTKKAEQETSNGIFKLTFNTYRELLETLKENLLKITTESYSFSVENYVNFVFWYHPEDIRV